MLLRNDYLTQISTVSTNGRLHAFCILLTQYFLTVFLLTVLVILAKSIRILYILYSINSVKAYAAYDVILSNHVYCWVHIS